MKIYLSSTYIDLKVYREKLGHALRKAGYEVVMMEEYVARDQRVEFACQGDVIACDVYVGLFAWRYGYIPKDTNPNNLSVTEMEYVTAGNKPMTRLTFLLNEKIRWPKERKDTDLTRIKDFRERLKEQCSAYFGSANELAVEVMAALRVHESTRLVSQLEAIDVLFKSKEIGPSYIPNIKDKLKILDKVEFIELRIGPTPWWNTRLYLLAALAQEFGPIRGIVFTDGEGKFLLMAAPSEICYRLSLRWPKVEEVYQNFRREIGTLEQMGNALGRYPLFILEAFGMEEKDAIHCLTERDLDYELGIVKNAEIVNVREKGQRFLQQEILGRQTSFVALVRDDRLEELVDREQLAQRVAQMALL